MLPRSDERFEVLGSLGPGPGGDAYWLGRERDTGQLVALRVTGEHGSQDILVQHDLGAGVPAGARQCYRCQGALTDWRRYCPGCGADLTSEAGGDEGELKPADLNSLLAQAARDNLNMLGQMKRAEGGGAVFFARQNDTGEIVALSPRRSSGTGGKSLTIERSVFAQATSGPARSQTDPAAQFTALNPVAPPETTESERICPTCGTLYPPATRFCSVDGSALLLVNQDEGLIGKVIADRYLILRKLGQGGMAQVYLAEHVKMGRRCALKVLNSVGPEHANLTGRFSREAANASRITHPNVATIYDFGETPDRLIYLAMEYVDGDPLTVSIRKTGRLSTAQARDIAVEVAAGLAAAHRQNVVHRDLKPDNILIGRDEDGRDFVKVVDFGIAKAVGSTGTDLTRTGFVVGTPKYMSPEQLIADPIDVRTDIYSLGCVLFEMLTGDAPFGEIEGPLMLSRRLTEPPQDPRVRNPLVQPDFAAVVMKALARSPRDRFQSATEMRDALRTLRIDDDNPSSTSHSGVRAPQTPAGPVEQRAPRPQPVPPATPAAAKLQTEAARAAAQPKPARAEKKQARAETGPLPRNRVVWLAAAAVTVLVIVGFLATRPRDSVSPPQITDIALRVASSGAEVPAELRLLVGDTVTLSATPADSAGNAISATPIWSSPTPSVVAVDPAGRVSALAAGQVTLSVSAADVTKNITVAVAPRPRTAPPTPPPVPTVPDGTLQLVILPWANVRVDDLAVRPEQQKLQLRLAPGKHRLRLDNPNFSPVDTTFEVTSGATTALRINMPPRS